MAPTSLGDAFLPLVLQVLAVSVVVVLIGRFFDHGNMLEVPRVGKDPGIFNIMAVRADFLANGYRLLQDGYLKFKDSMFKIQTADMERVVLSIKYCDELRSLPETQLSLRIAMSERHLGQYTTVDTILESHLQNEVCRVQLTQTLGRSIRSISEEIDYALNGELGGCNSTSWHSYNGHNVLLGVVSRAIARVFVGSPLCRDPEWLEAFIGYTQDVFQLAGILRNRHWLVRPLVYPFLSSRRRIKSRLSIAKKHLLPLPQERAISQRESQYQDLLQWITDSAKGKEKAPEHLLLKILFLCMASIHTSTATTCHALFDLCAMPEIVQPLRIEIDEALKDHGSIIIVAINDMKLLDSFLKESQRKNHPGSLSFNRKVMKDITLSDGTVLQAGTFISMPTASIANDPQYYSNPDQFDPYRFYNLRQSSPQESNRHQFTSTAPTNLAFGYGKFSCPGRFFAAVQIKLVLIKILLGYDLSFPGGQTQRPSNAYIDERIAPDRKQMIRFRAYARS